jgi:hypothetical protein
MKCLYINLLKYTIYTIAKNALFKTAKNDNNKIINCNTVVFVAQRGISLAILHNSGPVNLLCTN